MASTKYNLRNPAVKRIMQEMKEMQKEQGSDAIAEALEDNIFEWHFVLRGPYETEFAGGIYHGRILLPAEYPMKPPSFMMLTPSGRFEVNTKICLSISSHHPEQWQPSWSIRTALTALIAFMPTPGNGAIGSLDVSKEERLRMAKESRAKIPRFGGQERQGMIDRLHQQLLSMEMSRSADATSTGSAPAPEQAGSRQPLEQSPPSPGKAAVLPKAEPAAAGSSRGVDTPASQSPRAAVAAAAAAAAVACSEPAAGMPTPPAVQRSLPDPTPLQRACIGSGAAATATAAQQNPAEQWADGDAADRQLTRVALALAVAIAALLLRKLLAGFGYDMLSLATS